MKNKVKIKESGKMNQIKEDFKKFSNDFVSHAKQFDALKSTFLIFIEILDKITSEQKVNNRSPSFYK